MSENKQDCELDGVLVASCGVNEDRVQGCVSISETTDCQLDQSLVPYTAHCEINQNLVPTKGIPKLTIILLSVLSVYSTRLYNGRMEFLRCSLFEAGVGKNDSRDNPSILFERGISCIFIGQSNFRSTGTTKLV